MGIITKAVGGFAKSKIGTRLYKWAASEKGQRFLYRQMPQMETVISTACYVVATERQKNLNRREKNVLQWQNIGPAVIGVAIGSYLNKKVFELGEKVMKYVDPHKVKDVHKVRGAISVAFPIIVTGMLMRWLLPVGTAFVSGEIEERRNKKKLDVKV